LFSVASHHKFRRNSFNSPSIQSHNVPKISRSALISALVATVLFGSVPAAIRLIELDSIALGIVRLELGTLGMGMFMTP
jgi:hypothetical protein